MTTTFELGFPSNLALDEVTAFARAVATRPSAQRWPLLFELRATPKAITWRITVHDRWQAQLLASLHAHLPSVRVETIDPASEPTPVQASSRLGIELRLSSHRRPLRTDVAKELTTGVLATASRLHGSELLRLQWLVGHPLPLRVAKPAPADFEPDAMRRLWGPEVLDAEQARRANDKQAEPVVAALARIAVTAATANRRRAIVTAVLGSLRIANRPSAHVRARVLPSSLVLRRVDRLAIPWVEWPAPLNAAELATMLAWPIEGPVVSGVTYSGRRELPFVDGLLKAPTLVTKSTRPSAARIIGAASYPSRPGLVDLSARDALSHTAVIGPTGVGKSTLLANLALQDIAVGRAVVVVEPKGDLVNDILERIPPHRRDDVVLFDPSNAEHSVGLNLLHGSAATLETRVDAIVHLFHSLFSSSWGPRTQDVLHASLLSLARTPGMTLVELPLLLIDQRFRRHVLQNVQGDPATGPFWAWFEALSDGERAQVVAPVLNKARVMTLRSSVRRIVGQAEPRFALRDIFTRRRILLVALKRGEIGPETASLLGGLIVSQLWQVTQERASLDPAKRHPVMAYLDEFQTYLHAPTGLDEVMAQARGLGLGLTLAHQHLGQLSSRPELKSAVQLNARSKIIFQTGPEDASPLAKQLGGGLTLEDLGALSRYEAYARLMHEGTSTNPGSLLTLPIGNSLGNGELIRARSIEQYARPATEIDEQISARANIASGGPKQSGGRRKRAA